MYRIDINGRQYSLTATELRQLHARGISYAVVL